MNDPRKVWRPRREFVYFELRAYTIPTISTLFLTQENLDNLIQNKDPSIELESFVNPDELVNSFHINDNLLNNNEKISIFPVFHSSEIPYHPKPLFGPEPLMYVVLYINNPKSN